MWRKVESVAEEISGWIAEEKVGGVPHLLEVSGEPWATQEFKPGENQGEQSETIPVILEAVNHYYNNSDTTNSLYSSNNLGNDLSVFKREGFPLELILAIAAEESKGTEGGKEPGGGGLVYTAFNNALVTWDDGYGIMQLTSTEYKGMGSGLTIGASAQEYVAYRWVWVGYKDDFFQEYRCNWYSNTRQGIYSNIKDGLRKLQDVYLLPCSGPRIVADVTFTCSDLQRINAVWGYNGFVFTRDYLARVADRLETLNKYFPGESYSNEDNLIWKLRIANANKEKARLWSPCDLCVTNPNGERTGVVQGQIYEEIICSMYNSFEESVTLILPEQPLLYSVSGTSNGTYGFTVDSTHGEMETTFEASGIITLPGAVHQYQFNWDVLSAEGEGATIYIDSNGDGIFERTVIVDEDLTSEEFSLQTETTIDFEPDTLNHRSPGKVVTIYIELPEGFDLSSIDVSTLKLNNIVSALSKPIAVGDYDEDGIADLMVKFDRQQFIEILGSGTQMVTLTGRLSDGRPIAGIDFIRVIGDKGAIATAQQTDMGVPQEQVPMTSAKEKPRSDKDAGDADIPETLDSQKAVAFMLVEAGGIINELGPESFNSEESAAELACAIDDVFTMLDEGMYFEAMVMLEGDILERTDGCANIGEPDENDWVTSIDGQVLLYPLLTETIELLESLL